MHLAFMAGMENISWLAEKVYTILERWAVSLKVKEIKIVLQLLYNYIPMRLITAAIRKSAPNYIDAYCCICTGTGKVQCSTF